MSSVPQPLQRSRAITHTAERDIKSTRIKLQLVVQRNSLKIRAKFSSFADLRTYIKTDTSQELQYTLFRRKKNKSETSDSLAIQQG